MKHIQIDITGDHPFDPADVVAALDHLADRIATEHGIGDDEPPAKPDCPPYRDPEPGDVIENICTGHRFLVIFTGQWVVLTGQMAPFDLYTGEEAVYCREIHHYLGKFDEVYAANTTGAN